MRVKSPAEAELVAQVSRKVTHRTAESVRANEVSAKRANAG